MSNPNPASTAVPQWTVGDRLAKARRAAGLSVDELAAELGIDRRTISRYENDKRTAKRPLIYAYALRTGFPVWWIEGSPEPSPSTDPEQVFSSRTWIADRAVNVLVFRKRSSSDRDLAHVERVA